MSLSGKEPHAAIDVDGPRDFSSFLCFRPVVSRATAGRCGGVRSHSGWHYVRRSRAKRRRSVILLQPDDHVGGMVDQRTRRTDVGNRNTIGGLAQQFFQRVAKHYGSEEVYQFEPHVASSTFAEMLAEVAITPRLDSRLIGVEKTSARIQSITLADGCVIRGRVFVDASYEGDLMARAKVPYTVGRESSDQYAESLAGIQPIGGTTFEQFRRMHPLPEKYIGWTTLMIPTIEFYEKRPGYLNTHQFPVPVSGLDDAGEPLPA